MSLFDLTSSDLNPAITPTIAEAGARHLILPLKSRKRLSDMRYDQARGKQVMDAEKLITIMLVHAESETIFNVRNPFASGGVYEDAATGAAAAAFGGYLREIGWPHGGHVRLIQGEDMGAPSELSVSISGAVGASIRVSGKARFMKDL